MLRNLSDTARLAAAYRAIETERENPLFRDRLAHRLAGAYGHQIADAMSTATRQAWVIAVRTIVFDELILSQVARGVDTIVNLAAGFDTRPYRLALPASLRWIEVDLPEIVAEKETLLADERPACSTTRVPLDLFNRPARQAFLADVCSESRHAVVVTEGLLIYLGAEDVAALAADLAAAAPVRSWILDLHSPALLRLLRRAIGAPFERGAAALSFAPADGPAFFTPHGWHPVELRSINETAARAQRLPAWAPRENSNPRTALDGVVCMLWRS